MSGFATQMSNRTYSNKRFTECIKMPREEATVVKQSSRLRTISGRMGQEYLRITQLTQVKNVDLTSKLQRGPQISSFNFLDEILNRVFLFFSVLSFFS